MTTIAVRDGVMASDGQGTQGHMISDYNLHKIHKIGHCLVGTAGGWSDIVNFLKWYSDYLESQHLQSYTDAIQIPIPEKPIGDGFSALVLFPTGDIIMYEGFSCFPIESEYAAIGSGSPYALTALDCGKTAKEAVEAAIHRDVFSGGEIQTLDIRDMEEGDEFMELPSKEQLQKMTKKEIIAMLVEMNAEEEDEVQCTDQ